MKIAYRARMAILLFLLFLAGAGRAAAVRVLTPAASKVEAVAVDEEHLEKVRAKLEKKRAKYERRSKRRSAKLTPKLERKMKKQGIKGESQPQEVWDDDKFRLGVLLLLVAIGLGILGAIIRLGGLFGFMAGLFALGGVILLIWSLVEYYG